MRVFVSKQRQFKWILAGIHVCQNPPARKKKKNNSVSCCKNTAITAVYSQQGLSATITAQKLLPVIQIEANNSAGGDANEALIMRRRPCGKVKREKIKRLNCGVFVANGICEI